MPPMGISGFGDMNLFSRGIFAVLVDYLPAQLGDDEIAEIVGRAVEQTGAAGEGMRAMGKVMGVVQPQVKGKADGGKVAAEVRRQLGA